MTTFRKNPIEIEAVQFTGHNWVEMDEFCGTHRNSSGDVTVPTFGEIGNYLMTEDPEIVAEVWDKLHSSWVGVRKDQWIIRGTKGEFYPCDEEVFRESYVEVTDEDLETPSNETFFYHDADTMDKVYRALENVGLDEHLVIEAVSEMQNNGILFRELKQEADI